MRAIQSTIVLATLLIASVLADHHPHAEQLAKARATGMSVAGLVAQRFNELSEMQASMSKLFAPKTSERHFGAEQATPAATPVGTCDQEGFSAAQVVVLQACPSLSGLISGTVAITDFLPGFCGSNCYKVIAANLPKFGVCLDASTKPLVNFVTGCALAPECYTEDALKTGLSISASCSSKQTTVFNFYNATTAAQSDIASYCGGTCLTQQQAYINKYPRCLTEDPSVAVDAKGINAALTLMCSKTGGTTGDYCAWNLRSLGYLDCTNNCRASAWCSSTCQPTVTTANLDATCNSCLSGLVNVAAAMELDRVTLGGMQQLFCTKATNSSKYCYIEGTTASATLNPTSQTSIASSCSGTGAQCMSTLMTIGAAIAVRSATTTFTACASYVTRASNLYFSCQSSYERKLRSAAAMRATANLVCAQGSDSSYCMPYAVGMLSSSCFYQASNGYCGTGCSTILAGFASSAGCCLNPINDYMRSQSDSYYSSDLPTGTFTTTLSTGSTTAFTFDPEYALASLDRSQQPMNALAACDNTSTAATTMWSNVENSCMATGGVSRSVSLKILYSAVSSNKATMKRVLAALRADVAAAAGVAPSAIKNDTITASTTVTVTTSRRASGAGISFNFVIDAGTTSSTAGSTLDSSINSGAFVTANTGAAVASGCSGCVASGQDPSNLSAGGSGGSGSSSASTMTAALAGAAAIAALLL